MLQMLTHFQAGARTIMDRRPKTGEDGNPQKDKDGKPEYETYRIDLTTEYSATYKRDSKKRICLFTPEGTEIKQDKSPDYKDEDGTMRPGDYTDPLMKSCKSKIKKYNPGKEFSVIDEAYVMEKNPGMFKKKA